MLLSKLRNDSIQLAELKRTLFAHGYAVFGSYIVYKDSRIAKIEVRSDGVWLFTHSRKKGYCRRYKVRNASVALHKLRQSYLNFLEAAERPGVRLPRVPIARPSRTNALTS